ncbi:MAG: DUF5698 domain-containing protein [Deinococcales bacterium]
MTILLQAMLIFSMRIADVSIGALRIIMVVRGRPLIAGILGFCESIIWLLVAGAVLGNLDNPVKVIAYVGGYAAGTMLGSNIERWLASGRDGDVRIAFSVVARKRLQEMLNIISQKISRPL